jgi:hypothetical protein
LEDDGSGRSVFSSKESSIVGILSKQPSTSWIPPATGILKVMVSGECMVAAVAGI